jgi:nucleotide-binding universal stress UspA family protein
MKTSRACSILVPVDGSESAERAVRLAIRLHARLAPLEIHLLYVHVPPVAGGDASLNPAPADAASTDVLGPAKALLDGAGIPYTGATVSGYVASTIVSHARAHDCDAIVMGTRGMGSTEQVLGSIARQVIHLADVPVTLVK